MKKYILGFVLFVLLAGWLPAQQGVQLLQSAEANGRGGLQTALVGISSFYGNPAGLAEIKKLSFLAGGESRYLGTTIKAGGAGAAIPTSAGVIGIGIAYFGESAFNEQQVQLSFSKKLLDKFALCVRGYLLNTSIDQYGSAFVVSGDIGVQGYLTDKLTVGFLVINPAQVALVDDSPVPTLFLLGANYDFSKTFSLNFELEKGLNQNLPAATIDPNSFLNPSGRINIKGGLVYRPDERFAFRLGLKSSQPEYSFGMGYKITNRFWLDAVGSYHEILGFTPGVTIRYQGDE